MGVQVLLNRSHVNRASIAKFQGCRAHFECILIEQNSCEAPGNLFTKIQTRTTLEKNPLGATTIRT